MSAINCYIKMQPRDCFEECLGPFFLSAGARDRVIAVAKDRDRQDKTVQRMHSVQFQEALNKYQLMQ